ALETAPLKVLIADDHPLIIAGIRRTLERSENIEIVGEAHSGTELLSMVERRGPQLVMMDFRMPGISGTECIEHIRSTWPEVKIHLTNIYRKLGVPNRAGAGRYALENGLVAA